MPAFFFVLLSNWPVVPIALMDIAGVGLGVALYVRRRDWPPIAVAAAFGVRALSSVTRLLFYLTNYMMQGGYYYSPMYDPVTGAALQQTMNCLTATGAVLTEALILLAIWFGFTRKPGEAPLPDPDLL